MTTNGDSTDVVQRARAALDERDQPTRDGHGHVRPRLDGNRMRCGGPRLCKVCQAEAARTPEPWGLVRELADELEATRRSERENQDLAIKHYVAKDDLQIERDELRAEVERVRRLAERWEADPCVCGYRIPDGNDTDSQCLHCGATSLLRALDEEAGRG